MKPTLALRFLAAVIIVAVCWLLVVLLRPAPSAFPVLPQLNGYDALVKAAAKVIPRGYASNDPNQVENEEWHAKNQAAFAELRKGLTMPTAVPVGMSEQWISIGHTPEIMSLKAAAVALEAETRFLAAHGDTNGAVQTAIDLLHLGQAMQRGGVLIDFMVGSACEVMAARGMTNLLAGLNAEQCKRLAGALQQREAEREPYAELQRRETEWSWKTFGLIQRLRMILQTRSLHPYQEITNLLPKPESEYGTRVAEIRKTAVRLAARAYELDHARKPVQMSELIPVYLSSASVDPNSGSNFALPLP